MRTFDRPSDANARRSTSARADSLNGGAAVSQKRTWSSSVRARPRVRPRVPPSRRASAPGVPARRRHAAPERGLPGVPTASNTLTPQRRVNEDRRITRPAPSPALPLHRVDQPDLREARRRSSSAPPARTPDRFRASGAIGPRQEPARHRGRDANAVDLRAPDSQSSLRSPLRQRSRAAPRLRRASMRAHRRRRRDSWSCERETGRPDRPEPTPGRWEPARTRPRAAATRCASCRRWRHEQTHPQRLVGAWPPQRPSARRVSR